MTRIGRWCGRALGALLAICVLVGPSHAQSAASGEVGSNRLDLQLSPGIGVTQPTAAAAGPAATAATPSQGFASTDPIEVGDTVTVTVYREPDMGVQDQKVRPDGTLAMPLLGDVQVQGMNPRDLKAVLTRMLADGYLKQPSVTVNVERYRLYFIKGEVQNPGGYTFVNGLTLEKAIALAGGYTERAARSNVTLVRERTPDRPIKGAALSSLVLPGDVITVEESFF